MQTDMKTGFVAMIGRPNVGKSTLMNHLIGQKIAITSNKPQTTRNKIQTVLTKEEGQIIFLDTPGMHKAKNKLGDYMMQVASSTLRDCDIVLWLIEPSTFIGKNEMEILEKIKRVKKPVFLIVNKIDSVTKLEVLECIDRYRKIYEFAEVIPISAIKGDNTQVIIDCVFKYLDKGPMYYDEDTITDQPVRQIVAELIREQALKALDDEIPHGIAVSIEQMKYRKQMVDIDATIICEKDSHKGMIIGKQGSMLKRIGTHARFGIEELLESKVNLQLWVKVKKDWRDSEFLLQNFGYQKQDSEDKNGWKN